MEKGGIYFYQYFIYYKVQHTLPRNFTFVSNVVPLIGKTLFEGVSYSRKEEIRVRAKLIPESFYLTMIWNETVDTDIQFENLGDNLSTGQQKLLKPACILPTRNINFNQCFFQN